MNAIPSVPHLSATVVAAGLVYVSGQFGRDSDGCILGDVQTQTQRAIQTIERCLRPHGLTLRQVAKTTVWLRSADDVVEFNAAYAAAFGDHRPARSTLVCELVRPEALVEIEAVAVLLS